ncbi:hypothetical protein [Fictibacillus fluitans]|uniref:Uncharacterized protein n=1 Tax=Fictibacillus fluitans TaxID=3058422 RepID=A0ABT8HUQ2_9BACL|nr:hypothetical protein [Fictibacillus sp. NE201]MDN4523997.1 hypothetical protein [Fictibacillus sp. NE201]
MKKFNNLQRRVKDLRRGTSINVFLKDSLQSINIVFVNYHCRTKCVTALSEGKIIIFSIEDIVGVLFPFYIDTNPPVIIPCRGCSIVGSGTASPTADLSYSVSNMNVDCDCENSPLLFATQRRIIRVPLSEEIIQEEPINMELELNSITLTGLAYDLTTTTIIIDPLTIAIDTFLIVYSSSDVRCDNTDIPSGPYVQFIKTGSNTSIFNSSFFGPVSMTGSITINSC